MTKQDDPMDRMEVLEHNLKVERESRDHFHRELIQADVIITSLNRRLERLLERNELLEAENEQLKIETTCNYCNKYHGREVCQSLLAVYEAAGTLTFHLKAQPKIILAPMICKVDDAIAAVQKGQYRRNREIGQ